MITFRPVDPTRWTSRTLNSSSSPNNTDVASDMLVASLLDVVEDQQHVGATSLSTATTRASRHPAQVRRALMVCTSGRLSPPSATRWMSSARTERHTALCCQRLSYYGASDYRSTAYAADGARTLRRSDHHYPGAHGLHNTGLESAAAEVRTKLTTKLASSVSLADTSRGTR